MESQEDVQHYKVKVCMLGNEGVGKSSLTRKFVLDEFSDDYIPTLGTKITKKDISLTKKGQNYLLTLMVYDINGHWDKLKQTMEDFKNLVPENFYANSEGILIVCDLTRRETFLGVDFWHVNLIKELGHEIPCIILGNKSDLQDQIAVSKEEIELAKDELNSQFKYTSAKTGENVGEAFLDLANKILDKLLSA